MGAGEKLFGLAEAHPKWPRGATRRLVPAREQEELVDGAVLEQSGWMERFWSRMDGWSGSGVEQVDGAVLEQPAECFSSRDFCGGLF